MVQPKSSRLISIILSIVTTSIAQNVKEVWTIEADKNTNGGNKTVECVEFSADQQMLAAGCGDGYLRLFRVSDKKLLWEKRQFSGDPTSKRLEVECIAFTSDGKYIASAGNQSGVRIWNVADGSTVTDLPVSSDGLGFSPNSSYFIVGNTTKVYSVPQWKSICGISHGGGDMNSVSFTKDSELAAVGCADKTVRVVRVSNCSQALSVKAASTDNGSIKSVRISPDGRHFATANGNESCAKVFTLTDGKLVKTLPQVSTTGKASGEDDPNNNQNPTYTEAVAWTGDGAFLIVGGTNDGKIHFYETKSWSKTKSIQGAVGAHAIEYIDCSDDGKLIAVCGEDGNVRLFSIESKTNTTGHRHRKSKILNSRRKNETWSVSMQGRNRCTTAKPSAVNSEISLHGTDILLK